MHRGAMLLWLLAACGRSEALPPPARSPVKVPATEPEPRPYLFQDDFRGRRLAVEGPIRRGPYVQAVGATEATVCFESVEAVAGKVACDGKTISDAAGLRHEFAIRDLKPGTRYSYTIQPGGVTASFKTSSGE